MSEEIKSLKEYISTTKNEIFTTFKIETISNLIIYYEDLQQKVEQLKKENKELNRMCELYSQSLYNADLTKAEKKVEKLENIIKEAIKLLKKYGIVDEKGNFNAYLDTIELKDLLNILNKGSDKE